MRKSLLAGSLAFAMLGAQAQQQAGQETIAQQAIPDAPTPQTTLPGLGGVTPGKGISSTSEASETTGGAAKGTGSSAGNVPATPAPAQAAEPADDQGAVSTEGRQAFTLRVPVNFVPVPFTVKDSKGKLVAGLTSRDVRVYESGLLQHITDFVVDPFPLSVALVIDQSMSRGDMQRVNDSLGALPAAFAAYDEVAVFTYNNGPKEITTFTGAQSARLTQAIETSKSPGRDDFLVGGGPTSQNTIVNNQNFDPNTSSNRGHTSIQMDVPKEVHTLNDAILAAATAIVKASPGPDHRRVIYVISDGKEYGSEAKEKDVIQFLQRNNIEVDGTLVGDSAIKGIGFLDRMHLPLMMQDNALIKYKDATGGNFDAEFRTGAIEHSFAQIAEEARTRYVLGYYTHEPFIDGKYRKVEVKVLRPNLSVIAKQGYWPSAMDATRPQPVAAAQ